MWMLFEAFRKEVLALDPSVSEEFLKAYVAYRFETGFMKWQFRKSSCVCTEHALPRVARSPRISIQRSRITSLVQSGCASRVKGARTTALCFGSGAPSSREADGER